MKIVINRCYGGFEMSRKAEDEYLRRKGKQAYFYKQTKYEFRNGVNEYQRILADDNEFFHYTTTKDLGETCNKFPDKTLFMDRSVERTDPDLICVVEHLGKAASGPCSELSIIDIPDGIEYEIDEYDGLESVEETHRSWS
jgi:hypothetical protein